MLSLFVSLSSSTLFRHHPLLLYFPFHFSSLLHALLSHPLVHVTDYSTSKVKLYLNFSSKAESGIDRKMFGWTLWSCREGCAAGWAAVTSGRKFQVTQGDSPRKMVTFALFTPQLHSFHLNVFESWSRQ